MEKKNKYYVVRDKALPEVLQKVVEVKRLLEADKNMTVQEAAEQVGLSRSSFYKYKDDILDRKSTRLNSSHTQKSRMPSSA